MSRIHSWMFWSILSIGVFAAAVARADSPIQWRGYRGWEPEGAYCRLYDAKSVVTLQGTVMLVEKIVPLKGMGQGVYFVLKTDTETIPVHLGPTSYVEKQALQLHSKDAVEVTGSRVSCDGKPVILAATVKRGADSAQYRQLTGRPLWSAASR